MVHCSCCVCAMCLHSDTGWHEIIMPFIHCRIQLHQNVHKHWIVALGCCSFDMCSTRPYQTLVPCVFINISSQEDTVNALGLWLWTLLNALVFEYPQWNICTVFYYYFTLGCIPSSLQQFLHCYFKLFQFHSSKTLNITLVKTKLNNSREFFFFEAPLSSIPMQNRSCYFPWFPVLQWELVNVPNYTPTWCHRRDSWNPWWDLCSGIIWQQGHYWRVKSSLSGGIPERTLIKQDHR